METTRTPTTEIDPCLYASLSKASPTLVLQNGVGPVNIPLLKTEESALRKLNVSSLTYSLFLQRPRIAINPGLDKITALFEKETYAKTYDAKILQQKLRDFTLVADLPFDFNWPPSMWDLHPLLRMFRAECRKIPRIPTLYQQIWVRIAKLDSDQETRDQARENLLLSCLFLVQYHASLFRHKGLPQPILISAGCFGLLKAFNHYRLTEDGKFSSYASTAIKYSIISAFWEEFGEIKMPSEAHKRRVGLVELLDQNPNPTYAQIAQALEIPEKSSPAVLNILKHPTSFDETRHSGTDRRSSEATPRRAFGNIFWQTLEQLIDTRGPNNEPILRQIERNVLKLRLVYQFSHQEVAEKVGLNSRQRAQQVFKKAYNRIMSCETPEAIKLRQLLLSIAEVEP